MGDSGGAAAAAAAELDDSNGTTKSLPPTKTKKRKGKAAAAAGGEKKAKAAPAVAAVLGRWNQEDDEALTAAVKAAGQGSWRSRQLGTKSWLKVAENVPGRTDKSCRNRWVDNLAHMVRLPLNSPLPPIPQERPSITVPVSDVSLTVPQVEDPSVRQEPWSAQEDKNLHTAQVKYATPQLSLYIDMHLLNRPLPPPSTNFSPRRLVLDTAEGGLRPRGRSRGARRT